MKTSRVFFLVITVLILNIRVFAAFSKVNNFNNPGSINMFKYIPNGLNNKAPVVVLLHGCQQKAKSFAKQTGWTMMADELGLILLLPEQNSGNNFAGCFKWFEKVDIQRGNGEVASIANAIDKLSETDNVDTNKVFVAGLSAGASMASALMANYPEKINAGAIVSGVFYGCAFALSQSFKCMFSPKEQSAKTLGELIRSAAGTYKGKFPKVTIIHGLSDSVVAPANAQQSVSQWTNVHGIDESSDSERAIENSNTVIDEHKDGSTVVVERMLIKGASHGWPVAASKGCGFTGKFIIETGVCTVRELAKSWKL